MQQLSTLRRSWKLVLPALLFCYVFYRTYRLFRSIRAPSTESVLMSLAAAANVWEAYTLGDRKRGNSFSAVIFKLAKAQTMIPYGYGMLGTHLFSGDPLTLEAFQEGIKAGRYWPLVDKEDLEEAKTK